MRLAELPPPHPFRDWVSFCEQFERLPDAMAYIAAIPDDESLIAFANICECGADESLDWPDYRAAIIAEVQECWP